MRARIVILVVAILLGVLAALLTGRYLNSLERGVAEEDEPVQVLVAQEAIAKGALADELLATEVIVIESIPRRYVADGAVSSASSIAGQVLAEDVSAGEQITQARFEFPSQAGLAYSIPEDLVAVSIANTAVKGVSGLVKPGDYVMAVVTLDPGPEGEAISQVFIPRARVLAVGSTIGAAPAPAAQEEDDGGALGGGTQADEEPETPSTITLALSPADVERLVFAEEKGSVWLALLGSTDAEVAATNGQTLQSVLAE